MEVSILLFYGIKRLSSRRRYNTVEHGICLPVGFVSWLAETSLTYAEFPSERTVNNSHGKPKNVLKP
jgi:hypothetical protein